MIAASWNVWTKFRLTTFCRKDVGKMVLCCIKKRNNISGSISTPYWSFKSLTSGTKIKLWPISKVLLTIWCYHFLKKWVLITYATFHEKSHTKIGSRFFVNETFQNSKHHSTQMQENMKQRDQLQGGKFCRLYFSLIDMVCFEILS